MLTEAQADNPRLSPSLFLRLRNTRYLVRGEVQLAGCWVLCMADRNPPEEAGDGHQNDEMLLRLSFLFVAPLLFEFVDFGCELKLLV